MDARRTPTVVAVDVGGTTIKGELVDADGAVHAATEMPTPARDSVVAAIGAVCAELAAQTDDLRAAGVVVPGTVDAEAGIARYSANLGWRDVPLRALLEAELGVPVALDHDVRAAAHAERAVGAACGVDDCVIVVLGTGIAAVTVSGGRVITGATGLAGELGHMVVRPGGEPCLCGQLGCLERYASAAAIARRYGTSGAAEVVAQLSVDPHADEVWADATSALASGLATVTMLSDPELIALGGGLSGAGDALAIPVAAALQRALTWRPAPRLVLSPLGGSAGRKGAALLAWAATRRP